GGFAGNDGDAAFSAFRLAHDGTAYALDTGWATACDGAVAGVGLYNSAGGRDPYAYAVHRDTAGDHFLVSGGRVSGGELIPTWTRIDSDDGCGATSATHANRSDVLDVNRPWEHFGGSVRTPDDRTTMLHGFATAGDTILRFFSAS